MTKTLETFYVNPRAYTLICLGVCYDISDQLRGVQWTNPTLIYLEPGVASHLCAIRLLFN